MIEEYRQQSEEKLIWIRKMIDLVYAPLDDANVVRYSRLVKDVSGKVQLIYIRHNKIAMELAD